MQFLWYDHLTLLLRMAAVFYCVNWIIHQYNEMPFDWEEQLGNTGIYLFIFYLLYCLTIVLNFKGVDSSPLFLASHIEKEIQNYYALRDVRTLAEHRGVFTYHVDYNLENYSSKVYYRNVTNPAEIYGQARAFKYVLETIGMPTMEQSIKRLEKICEEARYMLDGGATEEIVYEAS